MLAPGSNKAQLIMTSPTGQGIEKKLGSDSFEGSLF